MFKSDEIFLTPRNETLHYSEILGGWENMTDFEGTYNFYVILRSSGKNLQCNPAHAWSGGGLVMRPGGIEIIQKMQHCRFDALLCENSAIILGHGQKEIPIRPQFFPPWSSPKLTSWKQNQTRNSNYTELATSLSDVLQLTLLQNNWIICLKTKKLDHLDKLKIYQINEKRNKWAQRLTGRTYRGYITDNDILRDGNSMFLIHLTLGRKLDKKSSFFIARSAC